MKKGQLPEMGTRLDSIRRVTLARIDNGSYHYNITTARRFIYQSGYGLKSCAVENILKPASLTPTIVSLQYDGLSQYLTAHCQNTFSSHFHEYGFNVFSMLVPDLMHEFELGVWKSIFIHLLRLLSAVGGNAIIQLNSR
jgi:hypothetical protein